MPKGGLGMPMMGFHAAEDVATKTKKRALLNAMAKTWAMDFFISPPS
jgi:hypothetical protein